MEINKLHCATGLDTMEEHGPAGTIQTDRHGLLAREAKQGALPPPSPASRRRGSEQGVAREVAEVERNPIQRVGGTSTHQRRRVMVRQSAAERMTATARTDGEQRRRQRAESRGLGGMEVEEVKRERGSWPRAHL
jgi:hypothetical protein